MIKYEFFLFTVVLIARTAFDISHVSKLEEWIDELDEDLPKLTQFILPVKDTFIAPSLLLTIYVCCSLVERQVLVYISHDLFVDVQKEEFSHWLEMIFVMIQWPYFLID